MIVHKIKAALLFLLSILKKSLCCLRRKRKPSVDTIQLTGVGVISDFHYKEQEGRLEAGSAENWNNWDVGQPHTVEEHIQLYRSQQFHSAEPDPQIQADFFQDMEPTIKKQKKILLRPSFSSAQSRLDFVPDTTVPEDSAELKSWEESENREGRWAESEEWDTEEILRQKRKEEIRKKKMERDHKRVH